MASVKPLVLKNGSVQQLQAGDTLAGVSSGVPTQHFVAGRYYRTVRILSSASNFVAGTLYLHPFLATDTFTLTSLGVRSNSTGHNIQIALYAAGSNGEPTGTPIVSTASFADASASVVSGSISSTQLVAGNLYWFAVMVDTSSAVTMTTISNATTDVQLPVLIGMPSAQLASTASAFIGLSLTGTFGTWPDLTSKTIASDYTLVSTAPQPPVVIFSPASVP